MGVRNEKHLHPMVRRHTEHTEGADVRRTTAWQSWTSPNQDKDNKEKEPKPSEA